MLSCYLLRTGTTSKNTGQMGNDDCHVLSSCKPVFVTNQTNESNRGIKCFGPTLPMRFENCFLIVCLSLDQTFTRLFVKTLGPLNAN